MTEDQIKYMTDRFLGWKFPTDFSPDNGISAKRPNYGPEVQWEPSGTNLFDARQAEEMVRYMVDGMPKAQRDAAAPTPEEHERGIEAAARTMRAQILGGTSGTRCADATIGAYLAAVGLAP